MKKDDRMFTVECLKLDQEWAFKNGVDIYKFNKYLMETGFQIMEMILKNNNLVYKETPKYKFPLGTDTFENNIDKVVKYVNDSSFVLFWINNIYYNTTVWFICKIGETVKDTRIQDRISKEFNKIFDETLKENFK